MGLECRSSYSKRACGVLETGEVAGEAKDLVVR
jgi:hypothetical protein